MLQFFSCRQTLLQSSSESAPSPERFESKTPGRFCHGKSLRFDDGQA
jgi:hypothetical protein